jgi:hypothetical protein
MAIQSSSAQSRGLANLIEAGGRNADLMCFWLAGSARLGETMAENAEQVEEMMQIYGHPIVGAVIRYMCDMSKQDLQSLKIIAAAFAGRHKNFSNVDRAHPNPTNSVS